MVSSVLCRRLAVVTLAAALAAPLGGCHAGPAGLVRPAVSAGAAPGTSSLELVESAPVSTSLGHADLADAWQVWPAMIGAATRTIDLAEFYLSDSPPSRLTPVIEALLAARARGVRVRLVADEGFHRTYPEVIDALAARGVDVRRLDLAKLTGGVMHAKYFVVDGEHAYLGSQNFDWRSLEHIQELGVRVHDTEVAGALEEIFAHDWALAGGEAAPAARPHAFPRRLDGTSVTFVASPRELLPEGLAWDLPALVRLVDSARRSVAVQVLTFDAGADLPELRDALHRALARGVHVRLITSDWQLRPRTLAALRALEPEVAVRIVTIPQAAGGFVPFARVVHAKYCVVDGERAWVGTSNWERAYFHSSRNVGLVLEGGPLPARLEAFFEDDWSSPYAAPFDPAREYQAPRVAAPGR